MIEATCSACGTLNRIAEADVPAGAKFVNCSSCKSRVALPTKTAGMIPPIPKPPLPKMPPPTPKGPPGIPLGPAGAASQPGVSDLPAPRPRGSALGNEPPAARTQRSAIADAMNDLPAPRPPGGGPPPSLDLDDLMGGADLPQPRSAGGVSDLPAPRTRTTPAAPPPPVAQPAGVSDLPAPKARPPAARPAPSPSSSPIDLPAPRGPGITDLPTPKAGISDLPAPKPGGFGDMLQPKGQQHTSAARDRDLPTPKSALDLPAPKGFFDDLPQPASGHRSADRPEVPAPKGFFDDLPQPARNKPAGEDIAPKGFFDDLPGRQTGGPRVETPEVPAPKGFFDDLPQPARTKAPSQGGAMGSIPLDLGDDEPIELAEQTPGLPGGSFDELDLSRPTVGEASRQPQNQPGAQDEDSKAVIRFGAKKPAAAAAAGVADKAPLPALARGGPGVDAPLELEEPKQGVGARLQPKRPRERAQEDAIKAAARARRSKIVLGVLLGVAVAGGGGFFLYQRHVKQQERADEIDSQLTIARKSLLADDANHWTRSAGAAAAVLELDSSNAEAFGLEAEASIAGALADGKNQVARFTKGRTLIGDSLAAGVTGPALDRAQALATLTTAPDKAVPKLQGLLAKSPKDGSLALYLGWAQSLAGDPAAATKAFDQAIALAPTLKILALDGRARAKLELADIEGARSDFNEIIAIQKDNIPAQVGLASTLPQSQAQQQEADLLAILARKDIKTADPRAQVQASVLAGYAALHGSRLDAARERFRKALTIEPKDVSAMTGLAETELRDRKLEIANDQIQKAMTQAPTNVPAQLIAAEIEIKLNKIDAAADRIQRLGTHKPPLPAMEQAQLLLITGRLLEAQNKDEAAIDAYSAAAKLAGDFDLTPTMAAVQKLGDMARKADEARNPAKEAEYKARAQKLLSALDEKAQTDPQLAMTLGVAYLQTGSPEIAEGYLRRVVEARPTDADALYQYGKALGLLAKFPEAIEMLKKARDLAPGRSEIGLELAITYERTKNDTEAGKLYDELVARDDASIETRAHAGKFYVRTNQIPKAGVEGTKIVAQDNDHAAGHYLKGEGLFAQGRNDDARKEFGDAVRLERDPMYLDGEGRADEAAGIERNDTALQDQALRAYLAATELDPLMFDPLRGAGRVYVARREHSKALGPLLAADQIKTGDPEVAFLLGVSYKELGQKKQLAIQWLDRSMKLKPNGEAAYDLGQLYTDPEIDKAGPAQAAFAQAVRLGIEAEKAKDNLTVPWLTEAMYQLGNIALANHDEPAAKAVWEKWLVRPGLQRNGARYDEVKRALATTLR